MEPNDSSKDENNYDEKEHAHSPALNTNINNADVSPSPRPALDNNIISPSGTSSIENHTYSKHANHNIESRSLSFPSQQQDNDIIALPPVAELFACADNAREYPPPVPQSIFPLSHSYTTDNLSFPNGASHSSHLTSNENIAPYPSHLYSSSSSSSSIYQQLNETDNNNNNNNNTTDNTNNNNTNSTSSTTNTVQDLLAKIYNVNMFKIRERTEETGEPPIQTGKPPTSMPSWITLSQDSSTSSRRASVVNGHKSDLHPVQEGQSHGPVHNDNNNFNNNNNNRKQKVPRNRRTIKPIQNNPSHHNIASSRKAFRFHQHHFNTERGGSKSSQQ